MHRFPSAEWTAAFKDAVNENPDYARAGADWTHGAVLMVVAADSNLGIDRDMGMLLDVHAGRCNAASFVDADTGRGKAPFVIEGSYARWRSVIEGELDPIKAMMQGKLKLTKGHLPTIIRYVESSRQLVSSAQNVLTEFVEANE